ncbi:protein CHROMATIN REMODELING 4 [Artemisia annua]|uniref:Protein CHROMATIN REMODELING 4 n=1 Tax=Artemisia annua TaxID=35608 RepID=A0A2U1M273_ARTAN|nr:protein CHROMATIN REMODELING 4 [Artemisia annua]
MDEEKKKRKYGIQGERLNGHEYKKNFQNAGKASSRGDQSTAAKESCSGSKNKKQRVASDNEGVCEGKPESANKPSCISSKDDPGFETMLKMCEPYVSKLRDYWHKRQNAVIFDGQDRLHKVIFFVLSLLDNARKPILVLAASNTLSMWKAGLKWSKLTNVITYKGIKDAREFLSALESYKEKRSVQVLVILSSPDVFVEDLEIFDHLKWELILIDECQHPIVATHFQKIKKLVADMKLLMVTGEIVDIRQSYNNILSLLESKCTEIHADSDLKTNDNAHTLKERLSPYIAFKCNFIAREFKEYWVPVQLSSMQIEQYCTLLESNMERLSSSLKTSTSLHDILIQTRKCCDHPYLVDPTLRNSSKKDITVDPLDADINVSGKLQLLDKLLLEIKRRSLRVLVLFQPVVSSEKISTGDMLDDLIYRRFGEDSYVRIGTYNFRDATEKRKEALTMFNNVNSKKYACLLDYHACHISIKLSRVDVAILFNSDVNPLNDIKSIQKVTIGPHREPLKIFRLYSSFTIEEKSLIFSKQGTTLDNNISYNNCQRLLAWGASYLFSNLRSYTNSKAPSSDQSFIDDIVHEFSYVLQNKSGYTSPSNRSMISNAQLHNGHYPKGILLFGETEAHTKESASVDKCLMGNGPLVFWSNLFKESQHRQKNSCSQSSRRVQKSPKDLCSSFKSQPNTRVNNNRNALPAWKRKAKRTKREVGDKAKQSKLADIIHTGAPADVGGHQSSEMSSNLDQEEVPRESLSFNLAEPSNTSPTQHNEQPIAQPSASISGSVSSTSRPVQVQQCQNNDPPHTSTSALFTIEIEKNQKELDKFRKSHQDKVLKKKQIFVYHLNCYII